MNKPKPVLPALGITTYEQLSSWMERTSADRRLMPEAVMAIYRIWLENGDQEETTNEESLMEISRLTVLEMCDYLFQMNGGGIPKVMEFIRDNPLEVALKHQELFTQPA